jgi:ABC-type sulfate transport system permease subunit
MKWSIYVKTIEKNRMVSKEFFENTIHIPLTSSPVVAGQPFRLRLLIGRVKKI